MTFLLAYLNVNFNFSIFSSMVHEYIYFYENGLLSDISQLFAGRPRLHLQSGGSCSSFP